MKLKYTLLAFIICQFSLTVFSQQKEFVLKWEDNKVMQYSAGYTVTLHGFQPENFSYDIDEKSLLFVDNIGFTVNNQSFDIVNIKYEDISEFQLKAYDLSKIKSEVELFSSSTNARGKIGGYIEFNPIVKKDGQYKKIVAVTVNFHQGNNSRAAFTPPPSISNSVMANGEWYKFYINKTGVHKLDRSFFSSLGVSTSSVNPQNIRLFGNGGKAIPLLNANVNEFDVTENAVKFVGENDGSFDANDYMLFYGVSSKGWDSENNTNINPYADRTYYYINVGSDLGKRIQPLIEPSGVSTTTITKFNEYQFHEVDETNIVRLGRRWFGNDREYWLDPAQRRFYPEAMATDYIGFRCAMSRVGAKSKGKGNRKSPR